MTFAKPAARIYLADVVLQLGRRAFAVTIRIERDLDVDDRGQAGAVHAGSCGER